MGFGRLLLVPLLVPPENKEQAEKSLRPPMCLRPDAEHSGRGCIFRPMRRGRRTLAAMRTEPIDFGRLNADLARRDIGQLLGWVYREAHSTLVRHGMRNASESDLAGAPRQECWAAYYVIDCLISIGCAEDADDMDALKCEYVRLMANFSLMRSAQLRAELAKRGPDSPKKKSDSNSDCPKGYMRRKKARLPRASDLQELVSFASDLAARGEENATEIVRKFARKNGLSLKEKRVQSMSRQLRSYRDNWRPVASDTSS
jgi:hypothetical protein